MTPTSPRPLCSHCPSVTRMAQGMGGGGFRGHTQVLRGCLTIHTAHPSSTIKSTLAHRRAFRVGGRKNKDSAQIKTWHLSELFHWTKMKSTHLSLYCGAFQPLPSTLVPSFLSKTWLYLSKSSLGPITASAVLFMLSGMRVLVCFSTNIKFPQGEPHVGTHSPLRLLGSPSSGLVDPTPSDNYPSFFVIRNAPTQIVSQREMLEKDRSLQAITDWDTLRY